MFKLDKLISVLMIVGIIWVLSSVFGGIYSIFSTAKSWISSTWNFITYPFTALFGK